jgi:AraC-like DNA-binding protein
VNLGTVPSVFGVIALAFLALLLLKVAIQPGMDKPAKRLLLLLLAGMLAMAFCLFYIYAGMNRDWPRLASIEIGLAWWIGPSLYFYIRRLNGSAEPFRRRWYLHWVPAIAIELVLLPFFLREIPGETDLLGIRLNITRRLIGYVWMGFHLQLVAYILLALPQLRAYRERLTDNYSDLSVLNLRWLTFCCCGFLGVILAERLLPVIGVTSTSLSQTAGITVYLFVIALMYGALGHSRLALASATRPEPPPEVPEVLPVELDDRQTGKYSHSRLRDDSAQYYLGKLEALMATERSFLEGDLSLQSLAARVKLSPHHLSQILNEKLHKSFYDYINEQRVNHARQLLLKAPQATITDIAFDSGFNSKNSFYNAFKRHSGMSPSEFRRQISSSTP